MRLSAFAIGLLAGFSSLPALLVVAAEPAPVVYDDSWYRAEFWGGEYPDGFSVAADIDVMIRSGADLALPRDITCTLPGNATYQTWNIDRVESDALSFVAFTRITTATLTSDFQTTLDAEEGENSFDLKFKKGETYRYLTYYGEGAFLIEYKDKRYVAYADLWDASAFDDANAAYHEWLSLTCANGSSGWLFMDDVRGLPGIEEPRVPQWGLALDLDKPEPVFDENGNLAE